MSDAENPDAGQATDILGVALLALVTGLVGIGSRSLWLDEAISARYAGWGLHAMLPFVLKGDPNSTLYYTMLAVWTKVTGHSEVAIRLPSCLANVVTTIVVYRLGVRLFERRVGILAAMLFALNAFAIEYAQMARGYALETCLVTVNSWVLLQMLDRPRYRTAVLYGVIGAMAFWTHYFAAFVVVAHALTVIIVRRKNAFRGEFVLLAVLTAALSATAIAPAVRAGGSATQWIAPTSLAYLWEALVLQAGGSIYAFALFSLASLAAIVGLRAKRPVASTLLSLWFAVPFVLAVALSLAKPLFRANYLLICAPAFMLSTAAALVLVRRSATQIAFGIIAVIGVTRPLYRYYHTEGREDWRAAAAYVRTQLRSGDEIAYDPFYMDAPFEYYAERSDMPAYRRFGVDTTRTALPPLMEHPPQIWLLRSPGRTRQLQTDSDSLLLAIQRVARAEDRTRFEGIEIVRFVRQ